jgi:muramidase (phage lysozyme)
MNSLRWLLLTVLATVAAVMVTRQRMAEDEALTGEGPAAPPPDPGPVFDFSGFSFPEVSVPAIEWPAWTGLTSSAEDQPQQTNTVLENFMITTQQLAGNFSGASAYTVPPDTAAANTRAFLDMIAYSEGANYNTLFGGGTFDSFADHPRKLIPFTDQAGRKLNSSAAGRYQFLRGTWDELAAKLGLPDFSPASQDLAALELIRQKGALADVEAGRVSVAINKVAKVWASLPGAGYDQPERKLSSLLASYKQAGGNLEA